MTEQSYLNPPQTAAVSTTRVEPMTMQADDDRLGKLAYEAYATNTGGRSLATGDDLPPWEDLADIYKTAWIAAARTVISQGP